MQGTGGGGAADPEAEGDEGLGVLGAGGCVAGEAVQAVVARRGHQRQRQLRAS